MCPRYRYLTAGVNVSTAFLFSPVTQTKLLSNIIRRIYVTITVDRLCGLVVRVPGYRTQMYCASCEVRIEFICYAEESRPPL
jgi:hypothetical protein